MVQVQENSGVSFAVLVPALRNSVVCPPCNFWFLAAVSDTGPTERTAPKRRMPSPSHSSNGHSSSETSPYPVKKKKKPGAVSSSKDQVLVNSQCKIQTKGPLWSHHPIIDLLLQVGLIFSLRLTTQMVKLKNIFFNFYQKVKFLLLLQCGHFWFNFQCPFWDCTLGLIP